MEQLQKCNLHVMGISEEREKSTEETFEILMTENFLKLLSDTKSQFQRAQRTPRHMLKTTARLTAFKLE